MTRPRAYLVDDEAPALRRLGRLLDGRVDVVGTATDPHDALAALARGGVDVVFLDIMMPGMTGLELAARLPPPQPLIVFTTAHDEHALAAFAVDALDYLLKPIQAAELDRALAKIERLLARPADAAAEVKALLERVAGIPERIASRLGEKITFVELPRITHFRAEEKLTLAVTDDGEHAVDDSIQALEKRLSGRGFLRIHRATLVNLAFVGELHGHRVRLKDRARTELVVARDRLATLKERLGV